MESGGDRGHHSKRLGSQSRDYYSNVNELIDEPDDSVSTYLSKIPKDSIICLFKELLSQHRNLKKEKETKLQSIENDVKTINANVKLLTEKHATLSSRGTKTESEIVKIRELVQEQNNEQPRIQSNPVTRDITKYQFRIDGIKEARPDPEDTSRTKQSKILEHEANEVTRILAHLDENPNITDIKRLGQFKPEGGRARTVLVTVSSPWDTRKILSKAPKLKSYDQMIFISAALTKEEYEKERLLLKKRRELINNGILQRDLRIIDLNLYLRGKIVPVDQPLTALQPVSAPISSTHITNTVELHGEDDCN